MNKIVKAKNSYEVLKAAKKLLMTVGWTQGTARKYDSQWNTIAYCATGAIGDVLTTRYTLTQSARNFLQKAVGYNVPNWNDQPGRTKEEVLKTFDQAIKLAKKR